LAALVKASGVDSEKDLLDLTEQELDETIAETAEHNNSFKITALDRISILKEAAVKRAARVARLTGELAAKPEPELEPEPEPEPVLHQWTDAGQQSMPDRPGSSTHVSEWSEAELAGWLRDEMGLPEVAEEALREEVDGGTAMEMDIDDWRELGAGADAIPEIVEALSQPSVRRRGKMHPHGFA
jgi:hypothetical protein